MKKIPQEDILLSTYYIKSTSSAMVASTTSIVIPDLIGFDVDYFNTGWSMVVLYNRNAVGVAPESESRDITDYDGAGTFTVDAFSANVEAGDIVLVIYEDLINNDVLNLIFDLMNAQLTLQQTSGVLTSTAAEQDVYINNLPMGEFDPRVVTINLDNMAAGDRIIIREYYRNAPGGGLIQMDYETFSDADGGLEDADKIIDIPLLPNRYGVQITLQQDLGTFRTFAWDAHREE
jgi:hypothetical protein